MKRSCFTLVELLVVIATLAILIAISLPSLRSSRQQAKAIQCGSNIKQLVLGLTMYETENGTFPHAFDNTPMGPPPGDYPGDPAYGHRTGWLWFNYITDYSRKDSIRSSVLRCPSRPMTDPRLKTDVLCGNYGVNLSICKMSNGNKGQEEFIGAPLCSADISPPGETLLMVDSGYSLISWWHATDIPPVPPGKSREDTSYVPGLHINAGRYIWPGQEEDAINGRHPNKTVNVGFADNHVEKRKAESLFVEKTADGYRNKENLWQPK